MLNTMELYPPNYALEWRLQPDASTVAVGSGLYQILILMDHTEERQLRSLQLEVVTRCSAMGHYQSRSLCYSLLSQILLRHATWPLIRYRM